MRTFRFLFYMLSLAIFCVKNTDAQVHVSVNVNIGSQPQWGPVGYDHVD